MKTMRWILPLLLVNALPAVAMAQDLGSARLFVSGLYAGYDHFPRPAYVDRDVFAPPLLAAIRRDRAGGQIGVLDWDPICDCQDDGGMTVVKLEVSPVGVHRARAQVTLRGSASETRQIRLDLVETPAGWRVADVHTAATPSLLGLLKAH